MSADVDVADYEEVVVEVYAPGGQLLMNIRPEQFPLVIDGFEQRGVYMIRIVADHTVLYTGKVIVQ